jgi:TrwC relaxase
VQTVDGQWLSIYGRVLHAAKVAVPETHNTALEHHLTATVAVRFAERPGGDRSKRPVGEIVGGSAADAELVGPRGRFDRRR